MHKISKTESIVLNLAAIATCWFIILALATFISNYLHEIFPSLLPLLIKSVAFLSITLVLYKYCRIREKISVLAIVWMKNLSFIFLFFLGITILPTFVFGPDFLCSDEPAGSCSSSPMTYWILLVFVPHIFSFVVGNSMITRIEAREPA